MNGKNIRKILGCVALALTCVMLGTVLASTTYAEENKVIVTSPFTEAIAQVRGSVVGVNNYQLVSNNYGYNNGGYYYFPFGDDFGFSFGNPFSYGYGNGNGRGNGNGQNSSKEVKYGSGSGVVIADKYVLTNYHVVENASSLKISITGNETEESLIEATLVAWDKDVDVAVLYVPDLDLPPVTLGDSDTLQIGDWAICIGNPLGFSGTVTAGIISGLDREISSGTSTDRYGRTEKNVNSMIQTDAAINSGNSGGGMFNVTGELMGIPTLKYSGTRSNGASIESIGMCIPINDAKPVIEKAMKAAIINDEVVDLPEDEDTTENQDTVRNDLLGKPRLGVSVGTANPQSGAFYPRGAYIYTVEEGSPAEKAGLQETDIIVEADGTLISSSEDLMGVLSGKKAGDEVALKVFRTNEEQTDGAYMDLTVTLAVIDAVAQ